MDAVKLEAPEGGDPPEPGTEAGGPAPPGPGGREPILNAPWQVATLSLGLLLLFWLQKTQGGPTVQQDYGFSPLMFARGDWGRLFSAIFIHGAWAHVLIDAACVLAFGAPVARHLGFGLRGVLGFVFFFLACGALGFLGFALLRWGHPGVAIGASGAASGLMAAAARIIAGDGRVGPILSAPVAQIGGGWMLVNLVMAFSGNLLIPGGANAVPGWQPHVVGFLAGLLLIGVFSRLAGGGRDAFA